eukprot:sb/3478713/
MLAIWSRLSIDESHYKDFMLHGPNSWSHFTLIDCQTHLLKVCTRSLTCDLIHGVVDQITNQIPSMRSDPWGDGSDHSTSNDLLIERLNKVHSGHENEF